MHCFQPLKLISISISLSLARRPKHFCSAGALPSDFYPSRLGKHARQFCFICSPDRNLQLSAAACIARIISNTRELTQTGWRRIWLPLARALTQSERATKRCRKEFSPTVCADSHTRTHTLWAQSRFGPPKLAGRRPLVLSMLLLLLLSSLLGCRFYFCYCCAAAAALLLRIGSSRGGPKVCARAHTRIQAPRAFGPRDLRA